MIQNWNRQRITYSLSVALLLFFSGNFDVKCMRVGVKINTLFFFGNFDVKCMRVGVKINISFFLGGNFDVKCMRVE